VEAKFKLVQVGDNNKMSISMPSQISPTSESSITNDMITADRPKQKLLQKFRDGIFKVPCRNVLQDSTLIDFIEESIGNPGMVIFAQYETILTKRLVGIAILDQNDSIHDIYIDYLCTEKNSIKLGHMLMHTIYLTYCKKSCTLKLASIMTAIGFYEKLGFTRTDDDIMIYTKIAPKLAHMQSVRSARTKVQKGQMKGQMKGQISARPSFVPPPTISRHEARFRLWFDNLARNTVISRSLEGQYNSVNYKNLYSSNLYNDPSEFRL
jgi:hypothetical protein